MTPTLLYTLVGIIIFAMSLYAVILQAHLLRKILALNMLSNGIALFFIAGALRYTHGVPDPVPAALVITGIVVAVSATGFALALLRRLYYETGQTRLSNDPSVSQNEQHSRQEMI